MTSHFRLRRLAALAGLAFALIGSGATLAQQPTPAQCPGAPISRLSTNSLAVVTAGAPNNVRSYAGLNNALVGQLPAGTILTVSAGPICADGYIWWQISSGTLYGYTVEGQGSTYYLEPYRPMPIATENAGLTVVDHSGARFSFGAGVAPAVTVKPLPEVGPNPDGPYWGIAPAGVQFVFFDGTEDEAYPNSTLSVYPAAGFAPLDERAGQELTALKALILNETANTQDQIPEVPVINAAQVIRAGIKYLPLADGGKGVRFLTWYAQGVDVANNQNLRYEFRGFSADGSRYITAQFALRSSSLPDTVDYQTLDQQLATPGAYDQYLTDITRTLTSLPPTDFTPNLDLLDSAMQSVTVSG